jgi:hypothetical protein
LTDNGLSSGFSNHRIMSFACDKARALYAVGA